jgi:hypothetical protein
MRPGRGRAAAHEVPASASVHSRRAEPVSGIAGRRSAWSCRHLPVAERERLQPLVVERRGRPGARDRRRSNSSHTRLARADEAAVVHRVRPRRRRDAAARAGAGPQGRRGAAPRRRAARRTAGSPRAAPPRRRSRSGARRSRLSTTADLARAPAGGMRVTSTSAARSRSCTTSVPASRSPSRRAWGSSIISQTPTSMSTRRTMLRRRERTDRRAPAEPRHDAQAQRALCRTCGRSSPPRPPRSTRTRAGRSRARAGP